MFLLIKETTSLTSDEMFAEKVGHDSFWEKLGCKNEIKERIILKEGKNQVDKV